MLSTITLLTTLSVASAFDNPFAAKPKAWLDWPAVLTARARAVRTYELRKEEEGGPGARTRLFDAALLTWLTVVPPDRVGVVRRLRFQHTLKRRESCWVVDLSKRGDGHKTSKHYGPFHGELPTTLNGVLDSYRDLLAFELYTLYHRTCGTATGDSQHVHYGQQLLSRTPPGLPNAPERIILI